MSLTSWYVSEISNSIGIAVKETVPQYENTLLQVTEMCLEFKLSKAREASPGKYT